MRQSEQLISAIRPLLTGGVDLRDPTTFVRNLMFVHNVIVASERITHEAYRASYGALREYFAEHLQEERDHAQWLAADLLEAGVDVTDMPILAEAVAMAGAQYYLIFHVDPAAVLGYMVVLECFPMELDRVEELEGIHGKSLCRTLRYHAEHDPEHGKDVLEQIDKLDAVSFGRALQNAINTAVYLRSAIAGFSK